jgi:hypothetical protein
MSTITDYLDGFRDGPVFRSDLTGRFDAQTLSDWVLSGKTAPYRTLSPFPGTNGDVLIIRLSHPSPDEQWRTLVDTLRGLELYHAALQFRETH